MQHNDQAGQAFEAIDQRHSLKILTSHFGFDR